MITPEQWPDMEKKLHEAAKMKVHPQKWGILRSTEIEEWIAEGYDFDLDIIPAVAREARSFKGDWITSWGFFRNAVKAQHYRRMRQKTGSSSFADCKSFTKEEPPIDPEHVRKAATKRWREIKDGYLVDKT